jgi:hypothetical protein
MSEDLVSDNNSAWSADHCMAAEEVPGVIFSNRRIAHPAPALIDIAPTILSQFGLATPSTMTGRNVFDGAPSAGHPSDLPRSFESGTPSGFPGYSELHEASLAPQ